MFAGPRDDPFWVDLGAIFDLAQLRPVANPTETPARDSIAYMNVHAIVLQIPLSVANLGTAPSATKGDATQTVGVWASASRRKVTLARRQGGDAHFGPWVQVSRLGLPLINEAVIGVQDKDYWNHLTPADDAATFAGYILNPIIVRDAEAVGFYKAGGPLAACTTNGGTDLESARTDIVRRHQRGLDAGSPPSATCSASISARGPLPASRTAGSSRTTSSTSRSASCSVVPPRSTALVGACGPQANEPEAVLPKGRRRPRSSPTSSRRGRVARPTPARSPPCPEPQHRLRPNGGDLRIPAVFFPGEARSSASP